MEPTLRSGRIVGPIPYIKSGGKRANIPLGPCLIEPIDERQVDIIWGTSGQHSTSLSMQDLEAETSTGCVVFLDPVK